MTPQHIVGMALAFACLLWPIEPARGDELDDAVEKVRSVAREREGRLESENRDLYGRLLDAELQLEKYARTMHVSASVGDDQNPGTRQRPLKTIAAAVALMRDGYADAVLLCRGETFNEGLGDWTKSGRSTDEPIVVGAWGEARLPRPKVVAPVHGLVVKPGVTVRHLRLRDLHLLPADGPGAGGAVNRYGVWVRGSVIDFAAEGCRVERFHNNLSFSPDAGQPWCEGVTVRNCQVLDAVPGSAANMGQGLYSLRTRGLSIEGSVFDHNGWDRGGKRNDQRHNVYLAGENGPATVIGNLFADGASHGLQARAGGTIEGNLFVDNASHLVVSGERALVSGNVMLGGEGLQTPPRPLGFGLTMEAGTTVATGNIVAHKPTTNPNNGAAFFLDRGDHWAGPLSAELRGNIIFDWHGNGLQVQKDAAAFVASDNRVAIVGAGRKVLSFVGQIAALELAGNRYSHPDAPQKNWFSAGAGNDTQKFDLAAWATRTGDTSTAEFTAYPDPNRTPDAATREALRDGTKRPAEVLRWITEGFGR